jgi:hypothetical protein
MKKQRLGLVFWQVLICFGVLLWIYLFLDLLKDAETDTISQAGWLGLPPVAGAVRAAATMGICSVAGLPIRLHAGINRWWTDRPLLPLGGVVAGVLCFVLAFIPSVMDVKMVLIDGEERVSTMPDYGLSCTGWFLIAFSLLHFSNSKLRGTRPLA